jgi:hypothetical protein
MGVANPEPVTLLGVGHRSRFPDRESRRGGAEVVQTEADSGIDDDAEVCPTEAT